MVACSSLIQRVSATNIVRIAVSWWTCCADAGTVDESHVTRNGFLNDLVG